jgi:hypothetical protein
MWWSLDHDDATGKCNQGKFPLMNTVKAVFENNSSNSLLSGFLWMPFFIYYLSNSTL